MVEASERHAEYSLFHITKVQDRKRNTRSERPFVRGKSANGFLFEALREESSRGEKSVDHDWEIPRSCVRLAGVSLLQWR